jgi:hypothetical protein
METQIFTQISRRVYASLLGLYPREHRDEYGADMLQLFGDQCKSAKNLGARAALWLRTLIDLGKSALREQLSSPHRTLGLLEAPPNGPLPWKGVALVLIPGLLFFIAQVTQLIGKDWFFLLVYRGAFFLILPVLVVWVWKRRFPVWGLIPLGLLARTVLTLSRHGLDWLDSLQQVYNTLVDWATALKLPIAPYDIMVTLVLTALLLVCVVLTGRILRRGTVPQRAWIWLGIYLLLCAASLTLSWQTYSADLPQGSTPLPPLTQMMVFLEYQFTPLALYTGFLALVLFGALLSRRHGLLAALLPLGFLLPTVLFGRIMDEWPGAASPDFTFVLLASGGAILYRFVVALAGPIWIVRSASDQRLRRSSTIALIGLIVFQAGCNLAIVVNYYGSLRQAADIFLAISDQLFMGCGVLLALVLYQRRAADIQSAPEEAQRLSGQEQSSS